ncbi:MAG: zf-HC2 domain-containing protein [Allosphingosinicella sp.]|uniref:zf-HC2 domain-containing protein n=1 Tax=Allosphingosinicella sp. TaxID=2823234 RepID=UPI003936B7DC
MMAAVTDEMLMAYVDGELDAPARREVEEAIAADPALAARAEAERRLRARIAGHYAPIADEAVPERFRTLLGVAEPGAEIVDFAAARERRRPWLYARNFAAIAATFVVGMLATQLVPGGSGPIAVEDGGMVAQGPLARALDTQLASAQPVDAATRIGVTFSAEDGRICRSFDTDALAGLACRDQGAWRVVMTAAAPRAGGEYRQAGSGAALVLQAAQDMMADAPLDADAERRARDAGWD